MKFGLLIVFFVLFFIEHAFGATGKNGWTYRTTPSTCAATYGSPCGQDYWNKISETCATGTIQTPIDFSNVEIDKTLTQPTLNAVGGGCPTWVQFSTNYTFEVAFQDRGYVCNNLQVTYNSKVYTMQQIHFHTPSEHTIGGGYFSGEAHMVHKSSTGDLLVLGVFLQVAANNLHESNNTFFQGLWEIGGELTFAGEEVKIASSAGLSINPYKGLLPGRFSNYRYTGSLTTPPCTEGVQWFVFDQPIQISQYDLAALRKAASALKTTTVSEYGNTNRETQPTNGRSVLYSFGASSESYTLYDDDGTKYQGRSERFAKAAIVLSCFSTIVTLAVSFYISSVASKISVSLEGRTTAVGLEMGNKTANTTQYQAVQRTDNSNI